jgi:ketosteroid isomerase-like protein
MVRAQLVVFAAAAVFAGPLRSQAAPSAAARQVSAAESSFAATMASRDLAAFESMIAPDAIFFGEQSVLRGRAAVVEGWRRLFTGPAAPFSWKPESVEVLASGTLAHSSGPVLDAEGRRIGSFNSVWRREPDGTWLVVFDKGCH